jgi:hypothetical protein
MKTTNCGTVHKWAVVYNDPVVTPTASWHYCGRSVLQKFTMWPWLTLLWLRLKAVSVHTCECTGAIQLAVELNVPVMTHAGPSWPDLTQSQ